MADSKLGDIPFDVEREPCNGGYVDRLMRRTSFEALWPLFALAPKPAKELTESFSALVHLRPHLCGLAPTVDETVLPSLRVVHVGDGAHALTGAMFALKTRADNISVDPLLNERVMKQWVKRFAIRRLTWRKARIEDTIDELNALPPARVLVTFVHAHVSTDRVLDKLRWDAAFVLSCCVPGRQLSTSRSPESAGRDRSVLSTDRSYQVLTNV